MTMFQPDRERVNNLCTKLNFERPSPQVATVGIIEDYKAIIEIYAPPFFSRGYRVVGFLINAQQHPTDMQQRELANQIAQSGIDLAVIDAGLGYVNGMKLSLRLKEMGLPTILLSGRGMETPEEKDAADRCLLKPTPAHKLIEISNEMLGIKK